MTETIKTNATVAFTVRDSGEQVELSEEQALDLRNRLTHPWRTSTIRSVSPHLRVGLHQEVLADLDRIFFIVRIDLVGDLQTFAHSCLLFENEQAATAAFEGAEDLYWSELYAHDVHTL